MRLIYIFIIPIVLFSDTGIDETNIKKLEDDGPWLTGPLLTNSAYTIPKGHFNIEPYVYFLYDIGRYNSRGRANRPQGAIESINSVEVCQLGLTDHVDINIVPEFSFNHGGKRNVIGMGDLIIGPSFQLLRDSKDHWGLTWKVGLSQTFPSGRHENLDPDFGGTDAIGGGFWITKLYTGISKLFYLRGDNFLATRSAFSVLLFVPQKMHGKNRYGGDAATIGTLSKPPLLVLDIGLELTLTKNWALALDIENLYTGGSTFRGVTNKEVGNTDNSYILSFAPAIEYNFSKNLGIIAGVWFSAYGLNSEEFVNTIVAFNWYI